MIITREQRYEGEILPPWYYGRGYHDFNCDKTVYYLIPFNYLIRILRLIGIYWDQIRSQPTWIDRQIHKGIHKYIDKFNFCIDKEYNNRLKDAIQKINGKQND